MTSGNLAADKESFTSGNLNDSVNKYLNHAQDEIIIPQFVFTTILINET